MAEGQWWDGINTLALVDAIQKHARAQDAGFRGPSHSRVNSGLIGIARQIGMSDEVVNAACESDRGLTVYEP